MRTYVTHKCTPRTFQTVVPSGKLTPRSDDDPMLKPGELNRMALIHDEHIIYDTAQQHPRYLIEVEFKTRHRF